MCFRLVLSVLLPLLLAASLSAQTDCRQRTVPVSVFDRKTGEVVEPSVASFRGIYQGQPVRVASVIANSQPPKIILLLDVSGSMAVDPSMQQQDMTIGISIAGDLISFFPPPAQIGFAIFAENMERVIDLTDDRPLLAQALNSLRADMADVRTRLGGRTAFLDAVAEAIDMFDGARVGDTIYAITDGDDNASLSKPQSLLGALSSAGIRLFRVDRRRTDNPASTRDIRELMRIRELQQMTENTGGTSTLIPLPLSSERLPAVRESINLQYRMIQKFARLTVELPESVPPSADWRLELANVPRDSSLDLIYPRKLPACNRP